jgi:hypothetical protein
MTLPVIAVTKPGNIANMTSPAQVGVCQLTSVFFPGLGHGSLNSVAARAWSAMVAVAAAPVAHGGAATTLTIASLGDALRSYDAQVHAILDPRRYTTTYDENVNVALTGPNRHPDPIRQWNGTPANSGAGPMVTYYLVKGAIPCAIPGTGWHPWGLAADVAIWSPTVSPRPINIRNGRFTNVWVWLLDNAVSFGWSWENPNVGVDDAHLHYWAGDDIQQRVIAVERWIAAGGVL